MIVTNLGEARNTVIVWSADAVIAIGGSWDTLSEIALAKRRGGIPVITLSDWTVLAATAAPYRTRSPLSPLHTTQSPSPLSADEH